MIDEINDLGVKLEDGRSISFVELSQILDELGKESRNIVRDRISAEHVASTLKEGARILDAIASLPHLFAGI